MDVKHRSNVASGSKVHEHQVVINGVDCDFVFCATSTNAKNKIFGAGYASSEEAPGTSTGVKDNEGSIVWVCFGACIAVSMLLVFWHVNKSHVRTNDKQALQPSSSNPYD